MELFVKNMFNNNAINNTSSVKKTFIENDEILKTERGNSSPSSNLIQKRETHTEFLSRKRKILLTGDSIVNGICEKVIVLTPK